MRGSDANGRCHFRYSWNDAITFSDGLIAFFRLMRQVEVGKNHFSLFKILATSRVVSQL